MELARFAKFAGWTRSGAMAGLWRLEWLPLEGRGVGHPTNEGLFAGILGVGREHLGAGAPAGHCGPISGFSPGSATWVLDSDLDPRVRSATGEWAVPRALVRDMSLLLEDYISM